MRKILLIFTLVIICYTLHVTGYTNPAFAAIEFGGNSYEYGHTSSTKSILETVPNIQLNSSTLSGENIANLAGALPGAAASSTDWVKKSAGIDVIGILKTLGGMFVQVVEWMIGLIKQGLGKL